MGHACYRRVVLSPHLDDAALSCGGAIHKWTAAGEPVLVITLMAGDPPAGEFSPFAHYQHASWGLPPREAYAARRAEDLAAMRVLGAEYLQLDFLDCIYRRGPAGWFYQSDEEIFGAVHPADEPLADRLTAALQKLESLAAGATVYAPLGVGNHVDHQLVRRAAEAWRGRGLCYYEDYPYAETADLRPASAVRGLSPCTVPLTEADLDAKVEAIGCYVSQIPMLFGTLMQMEISVRLFSQVLSKMWAIDDVGS